jgi:hypothetical protein
VHRHLIAVSLVLDWPTRWRYELSKEGCCWPYLRTIVPPCQG